MGKIYPPRPPVGVDAPFAPLVATRNLATALVVQAQ